MSDRVVGSQEAADAARVLSPIPIVCNLDCTSYKRAACLTVTQTPTICGLPTHQKAGCYRSAPNKDLFNQFNPLYRICIVFADFYRLIVTLGS